MTGINIKQEFKVYRRQNYKLILSLLLIRCLVPVFRHNHKRCKVGIPMSSYVYLIRGIAYNQKYGASITLYIAQPSKWKLKQQQDYDGYIKR